MRKILLLLFLLLSGISNAQNVGDSLTEVQMDTTNGGTIEIPVKINDVLDIKFILDTGASESSIPLFLVLTLIRTETVSKSDRLEDRDYILADGSISTARRIQVGTVQIGDVVLHNISFSVTDDNRSPLLIGQNVLRQFKSVSFDYINNKLILIK
jgi:clan AA aspartic protease (TIGR02281 family)